MACGEGVDRPSQQEGDQASGADALHSYGMLLARALGAQCHLVCYGGRGLIRDWQGRQGDPKRPQKTVLRSYLVDTVAQLQDPRVVFIPSNHYAGDAANAHPTGEQHAKMARDFEKPLVALLGW